MPLHGKIVVIKRSGGDGTEFPLTTTCLFGRKADCDIRIQLPQVSKEHCRIDLNENKEVILTNLSSANPTRVNGEVLQQSERLKHGDVITITDRSFRFEYPPAPTPKKRTSVGGKHETLKVLRAQQVGDKVINETGEKISEVSADGANHDNIQKSLEKTVEVEMSADDSLVQNNSNPFSDLYEMIKKSLDVKTPRVLTLQEEAEHAISPWRRNSAAQQRFTVSEVIEQITAEAPRSPAEKVSKKRKSGELGADLPTSQMKKKRVSFGGQLSPELFDKRLPPDSPLRKGAIPWRSLSIRKPKTSLLRRASVIGLLNEIEPDNPKFKSPSKARTPSPQKSRGRSSSPKTPTSAKKSPKSSSSSPKAATTVCKSPTAASPSKRSPKSRSLSPKAASPAPKSLKAASPAKQSPKSRSPSPKAASPAPKSLKAASPAKQSPKSWSPSPKAASPAPKSLKAASPAKQSPKSPSLSPKLASPALKSPKEASSAKQPQKSRSPSPKAASPAPKSPKAASPAKQSPKSQSPSPKAASPALKSPKAASFARKSPKSQSPSPKAASPAPKSPKGASLARKSPKSQSLSPKAGSLVRKSSKAASPASKTLKSGSPSSKASPASKSPKAALPVRKSSKSRSPFPKTSSPIQKSPRVITPAQRSPKVASPEKRSPKPQGMSPAKGNKVQTPKGNGLQKTRRKTTTPSRMSHKDSTANKRRATFGAPCQDSQGNTPVNSRVETPTIQGRFSVSRISTPSPTADVSAAADQLAITPKVPMRRKSTVRKTPGTAKSVVRAMQRRSGISRASVKAFSYASIVKFGQTKAQVIVPTKKIIRKPKKKVMPKPQTPAQKLKGHVSTGHADSPVTIVVGRAHRKRIVTPTGTAPTVVINTALFKNAMKTDEDLSGVSEMFKTPATQRKRKLVIGENSSTKPPAGAQGAFVMEPSMLSTPEGPDEMVVSPLSVASTQKSRSYNSEAVQRLLNEDQESSLVSAAPAFDVPLESSEQEDTDLPMTLEKTPKQKPELPECLTGVKRIMKTPRQKAEPTEDLRGKILKTPKQKSQQQECLTGVKRIMKTPRQKAEPIEDLRGKILKTPKQKSQQQECLTGVKRIMKTPRQKNEPIEDLRGKILKTPKQRVEQQECLTGVKRILKTPRQKAEPVEDIRGRLLRTPKLKLEQQECLTGVKRIFKTPKQKAEPLEDLRGKLLKTPKVQEAGDVSLDGVKELLQTPVQEQKSEKSSQEVCLTGVKRLMKTPKEKSAPVEDMIGVERLFRTPRNKGEPVEKNLGIKRLMKSPRLRGTAPVENFEGLQELLETPVTDFPGQLEANTGEVEMPADSSVALIKAVDERVRSKMKTTPGNIPEADVTSKKKSVRCRRAKVIESKVPQNKEETAEPEEPVVNAPARGRRGKQTDVTAPPAVQRTTRGRSAKNVEATEEESHSEPPKVVLKPKRGRNVQKSPKKQAEIITDVTDTAVEPELTQTNKAQDSTALEKVEAKPKRRTRAKQPQQPLQQQQDAPQVDVEKAAKENCSDQLEILPVTAEENKALDTVKSERLTEVAIEEHKVSEVNVASLPKKAGRSRSTKRLESEQEDKQESAEQPKEPIPTALVRGRRGKKVEIPAPPVKKQMVRATRNAKSQESTSDQVVTVDSSESASVQTSNASQEGDSAPQVKEAVIKPLRGRKRKISEPAQSESEKDVVSAEPLVTNAQCPQPILPTVGKPTRGRRGKPDPVEPTEVTEDAVTTMEAKPQSPPPVRVKRGRNACTKAEQPSPPKRARRGPAVCLEETKVESTPSVSKSEPAKRGRRAATKGEATETNKVNSPQEVVKNADMTKKSVHWKSDLEVFEIQKVTPIKTVRGRKSKQIQNQNKVDTGDSSVSKVANKTEEEDLSDKADAQPIKRAKRGAKAVSEKVVSTTKVNIKKDAEGESQPQTRRGRSAKK
ncbi:proliferation marker protein Ki-67 isoform 2-T2 [Pholidichthys leucotaenia]